MELNRIQSNTTWSDASAGINANNDMIAAELDRLGAATYKNKGYFSSFAKLKDAYPTASAGAKAYVGSAYPYAVYLWDRIANAWVDSGETGGEESVQLGDFYTKEQTHEVIDDFHVVLTQEAYDALPVKEDKLYFIVEEQ